MRESYSDITSRIRQTPEWYDQNGTPRYDKFHPLMCPNIYTHQVALLRIACQDCGKEFLVEIHTDGDDLLIRDARKWHYGDPPAHCKGAGDSMNCIDLEVVECWHRKPVSEWKRVKKFEGLIYQEAE
jgi:hypothetical protein